MPTNSTETRDAICTTVATLTQFGSDLPNARIEFQKADGTPLCSVNLDSGTPWNAPVGGAMSLNIPTTPSPGGLTGVVTAAGSIAKYVVKNRSTATPDVIQGPVSDLNGTGEIKLPTVLVAIGDTIRVQQFVYQAPP